MVRAYGVLAAVVTALLLAGCQSAPPPPPPSAPPSSSPAPSPAPSASPSPSPSPSPTPKAAPPAKRITIELTGYSFADNTPPGSSLVCCSVVHKVAAGQGTFDDPITVAVPGVGGTGMLFPAGTKFYLPTVKRYVIVEDSGASRYALPHLDMWVDGRGSTPTAVESCMSAITGQVPAEMNPPPGRPVLAGPISSAAGCRIP